MERSSRICFFVSTIFLLGGFLIISAVLTALISFTAELPPSNLTRLSSNSSWINNFQGSSPEQSLMILFLGFLSIGLIMSFLGFIMVCCSINCSSPVKVTFLNKKVNTEIESDSN